MDLKLTFYYGAMILYFCKGTLQAMEIFGDEIVDYMNKKDQDYFKRETKKMFYHAYNAYMDNAYPADELMPLSCKGRYRGSQPDRGDIDSVLGNFSLTLVDTLDTLVILGDLNEFESAIKLIIRDVSFDTDVIVSLFETNIRMLGGLLSSHILAVYFQRKASILQWYKGELLQLARDLGLRLLPAFNTTTGLPFGRVNLKYGMKGVPIEMMRETCTACAGSMILEFAALSRLTGENIFEEKAQKAMDVLWQLRHRGSNLMGSILNVNSGDWIRRDSGVGAGIDSYYEYCLKAYILLGDEKYLDRFNKHYKAIMKYISQGPLLLDVHMHRPNTNSKNFMDALLAFWPGLQVLKGDIKPAIETHDMLYEVIKKYNFIPEAFTADLQIHWPHHPLRPEFVESTYFLYQATGNHYYLGVGRKILNSLKKYAQVPCGFASVSDIRINKHDDSMDSFVLSETFKYLYLLFADKRDLLLDIDKFIFTTEGHLLPLSLSSIKTNLTLELQKENLDLAEIDRTCPNNLHVYSSSMVKNLRKIIEKICPKNTINKEISLLSFQPSNLEYIRLINNIGIKYLILNDGSMEFSHKNAKFFQNAENSLLLIQDIISYRRRQFKYLDEKLLVISFFNAQSPYKVINLVAGPAQFGLKLRANEVILGRVILSNPANACTLPNNFNMLLGNIVVVERGDCTFIEKARNIQKAGAIAGIVIDNNPSSSIETSVMFAMSGDEKEDDIKILFSFLYRTQGMQLLQSTLEIENNLIVEISHEKKNFIELSSSLQRLQQDDISEGFHNNLCRKNSKVKMFCEQTDIVFSRKKKITQTN